MRQFLNGILCLFATLSLHPTPAGASQNTWDYSVQVSATVRTAPANITLSWPQDTTAIPSSYTIHRKAPDAESWGPGTMLPGTATSHVDDDVAPGVVYEYRIVKAAPSYFGYGYIMAAIEAPLIEHRGKIILVVDRTFSHPLAPELARLEDDLTGDGWIVIRHDVARDASVVSVKDIIRAEYLADPAGVKSVFLFGHIPVPYSGQFNPDGHPDHIGAWPADAYYGDMDGTWTDTTVNYRQTINKNPVDAARMSNVPGDGKFDQTTLPSTVELEVGRVDLAKMPGRANPGGPATFPSETELLRKYLDKDHAFRHRNTNPPRRAVLGDYFGVRGGEAFAASGFRSFAPLVGPDNIRNLNTEFRHARGVWIRTLAQDDYLLAYGCGPGSYAAMGGLGGTGAYFDGVTTELVGNNVRGVFNLLFGSWLGDWDSEDNFLRAPLATDHGLVSVWSGRPHWFLHPMGLGHTIGHVTRLTQNNRGLYETQINSAANRVHIALMGDPTLRLHPVVPAANIEGATSGGIVSLSWSASTDSDLVGYHVYHRTSRNLRFTRLTDTPITATQYFGRAAPKGAMYMVRAVKLESTPSGTYYNASQGVFWSDDNAGRDIIFAAAPADAPAPVEPGMTAPGADARQSSTHAGPAGSAYQAAAHATVPAAAGDVVLVRFDSHPVESGNLTGMHKSSD